MTSSEMVGAGATMGETDESTFAGLMDQHWAEIQLHCYRMVGSLHDAEDLAQEAFVRAWRKHETFEGRSTVRAWLYKIATNTCIDFLRRRSGPRSARPANAGAWSADDVPWLQPYPDQLLDRVVAEEDGPADAAVERETVELAFLIAVQRLTPRQRSAIILRDVLGWSAIETAQLLDTSVGSANSALQRARIALKDELAPRRIDWSAAEPPSGAERQLVERYMAAFERGDSGALAELVHEDVRVRMPGVPCLPDGTMPGWSGREDFIMDVSRVLDPADPTYFGEWRCVMTSANRHPAVARYVRQPGDAAFRARLLEVLELDDGLVREVTVFGPALFADFGLPATVR